jgi:hypothetical protein
MRRIDPTTDSLPLPHVASSMDDGATSSGTASRLSRRFLTMTGVGLIDAGTAPDVARWIIGLLGSVRRAYLPPPEVAMVRGDTILRFRVDAREVLIVASRPGHAIWWRAEKGGAQERSSFGPEAARLGAPLFDWLLEGPVARA